MIAALLLLVACSNAPLVETGTDSGRQATTLALGAGASVQYVLSVDWEGASLEDGARVFETDLGYRVGLTRADVATIGVQLDPCELSGLRWSPLDLLGRPALADHATTADSSLVSAVLVEDLLDAERVDFGVGGASGLEYCAVHWLTGATTEGGMGGQSVRLDGWVQAPDGAERPLSGEIWLSAGGLPELVTGETAAGVLSGDDLDAAVEIVRFPARALDGEELSVLSDAEIAYAFLAGLGRGAEARVWR